MKEFCYSEWFWDKESRAHAESASIASYEHIAKENGFKFGPCRIREDRGAEVPPSILEKGGDPGLFISEMDVVEVSDIVDWLENYNSAEHSLFYLLPRIGEAIDEIKKLRLEAAA